MFSPEKLPSVSLRGVLEADLPAFYEHQLDPLAVQMADFPSREREAFWAHWEKVLADTNNINRTILADGQVAGHIACFTLHDERDIGYWLGREFWGKGIATRALALFLELVAERPLYARVVRLNLGSQRVLEKCGFQRVGEEGEELVYKLTPP
jgi:RimJ/RimL family protein N-acetyltransferase